METGLYIAVDLGASKTRIALCSRNSIIEKIVEPTPRSGDENTIAEFIWKKVNHRFETYLNKVKAIGVATIGPLNIEKGRVVNTPNLPFKEINLLEPLTEFSGRQVFVANDAVAAAWGEKHYGLGRGFKTIIYLTLSTGVGAGVIVDDHLLIGKNGNAHEIGHIIVDFDSELECGCGGKGHWEAYAGGKNLPRVALWVSSKYKIRSTLYEYLTNNPEASAKEIFQYYKEGDPLAIHVVNLFVKASRAGIASIINSYDPEILILGGGIILNNRDILIEKLLDNLHADLVTAMPIVKITGFGDDVGLYGALALATHPPEELLKVQHL
ncbi:MAG: ROK family protein [Thermosphaera sp.]